VRKIKDHQVNACNEALGIYVIDEPGEGGACHRYDIKGYNPDKNPSATAAGIHKCGPNQSLLFQNGPIKEVGVNGITHEALLVIIIDRLKGFQTGPFACEANATALEYLTAALESLNARTLERAERGVEGTREV
jgi:hypothetical protein